MARKIKPHTFHKWIGKDWKSVISSRVYSQTPIKGHKQSVKFCFLFINRDVLSLFSTLFLKKYFLCFVDYMNTVQLGSLLNFSLSNLHYSKEYKERIRIQSYWRGNELYISISDKTISFRTF